MKFLNLPALASKASASPYPLGRFLLGGSLAALLTLGCSSGGGGSQSGAGPVDDPDGLGLFIEDPNSGGSASDLILSRVVWGRLVDVFGLDSAGERVPMFTDFVIGEDIVTNLDFTLELNAVTARETLVINRDVTDTTPPTGGGLTGRQQFLDLLQAAEANLTPVFDAGFGGTGILSVVRRNAAIVLQFNDLIDEASLTPQTVRILAGVPPEVPFEARLFVDPNHGGTSGGDFHSTRVIIDPTISPLEVGQLDVLIPTNGVGLPASVDVTTANIAIRIPTEASSSVGQSSLLTNLSGSGLGQNGNGTVDFGTSTADVLRLLRSGGNSSVTGDEFNGFLRDLNPPQVIGSQPVDIVDLPVQDPDSLDPQRFILNNVEFLSSNCARQPRVGDVFTQPGVFVEVVADGPIPGLNNQVEGLAVRLLAYPPEWDDLEPLDENGNPQGFLRWLVTGGGQAEFLSVYDPERDGDRPDCFAQVIPSAVGFPDSPTSGLFTDSTMGLRFSEPMDPASLTAFDSMTLTRVTEPEESDDFVVGSVRQSLDLQTFTFIPDLPLAHTQGAAENYYLSLTAGSLGPVDLAGNPLDFELPQITGTIDSAQPTQTNGGAVSRFDGADGEWGGQILFDLDRRLVKPRPVLRFDAVVDQTQLLPGAMTPFAQGVQTPLSKLGSKMQIVWRHADVGFSVVDNSNHNVDIEGLSWAPVGGSVTADSYSEFEIRLSHSRRLPDERIDPDSLFPMHNKSGLVGTFSTNVLNQEPQKIVHPKFLGYTVSPGDVFEASTGTLLIPFPLNRVTPQDEAIYFTWRDTSIRRRAAPNGAGAELDRFFELLGIPDAQWTKTYSSGQVRTVALPLLMEFRTFPDDLATGTNAFTIRLAVNSSAEPYFRAFSTGGQSQSGEVTVNPDLETEANGGFNPTSSPPGQETFGRDPILYVGSMDLVVRISRAHSVWFPVLAAGQQLSFAVFNPPVVEPTQDQQPLGTLVDLDFRGAINVTSMPPQQDALQFDSYGDYYQDPTGETQDSNRENPTISFLNGEDDWLDTVDSINGSNYYQVRATFTSNSITGLGPELSAVALSWEEQ